MKIISRFSLELHLAEFTLHNFNSILHELVWSWFGVFNVQHSVCITVLLHVLLQPLWILKAQATVLTLVFSLPMYLLMSDKGVLVGKRQPTLLTAVRPLPCVGPGVS